MVKQRIITALILALGFLGLLFFATPSIFSWVILLVTGIAAWEWSNLCHITSRYTRSLFTCALFISAWAIQWRMQQTHWMTLQQVLLPASIWWLMAFLWIRTYPDGGALWQSTWMRQLMGFVVLIPCSTALIFLYQQASGELWVLFLILVVASADIGAFFTGRAFGRRKLAPNVSPGKSWEGVGGGLLAVLILSSIYAFWQALPLGLTLLLMAPVALVSVVGDLFESMLKRYRGVKDSGDLLPGHGGVLDRIDGLVAAAPLFTLSLLILHPWP